MSDARPPTCAPPQAPSRTHGGGARPAPGSPEELCPRSDEVHVWTASLSRPPEEVERFEGLLSEDELQRAARFRFGRDRRRFIVARGSLREILARYVSLPPSLLRFGYNAFGKPELRGQAGPTPIRFNLSHSEDLALYAVAAGREVGVDVEFVREDVACEEVARSFFSGREVETLMVLPRDARKLAFFNCWTRKEAYIKARGAGLSLPLDAFDVSLSPGEPAALMHVRDEPREAARWSLRELSPAPGYVAALAVEGGGWRLCRCSQPPQS
jgi:4'-phosphopantetheinyl transferase